MDEFSIYDGACNEKRNKKKLIQLALHDLKT